MKWCWLISEILILFGVMAWIFFFPSADNVDDFAKAFLGFGLIYLIEKFREAERK